MVSLLSRKIPLTLFFLLVGIFLVDARLPTKVYIGYDPSVDSTVLSNALRLFNDPTLINFSVGTIFRVDFAEEMVDALGEADVIYLCPSKVPFAISEVSKFFFKEFVNGGGIVIYPSGFDDVRSNDVADWLSPGFDHLRVVTSTFNNSKFTIDDIYSYWGQSRAYGNHSRQYINPASARATNESLFTSFGRIDIDNMWGLPFQWFSSNLYWVRNNTHNMQLTPLNEDYCMFKREGNYNYQEQLYNFETQEYYFQMRPGPLAESCWVFKFDVGSGYVVEIANSFSTDNVFSLAFSERFLSAVAAAVGLHAERELFPKKTSNAILRGEFYTEYIPAKKEEPAFNALSKVAATEMMTVPPVSGTGFGNVAYDLSKTENVFVWRYTKTDQELLRLHELTNAPAFVTLHLPAGNFPGAPGYTLHQLARDKGLNLVVLGDRYRSTQFVNYFGIASPNIYNSPSQNYGTDALPTTYAAGTSFSGIDKLTAPWRQTGLVVNNEACLFYDATYGCSVWRNQTSGGFVTLMSWDWQKSSNNIGLDQNFVSYDRRLRSWPNLNWRAALKAALDPQGPSTPPVELFDTATLAVDQVLDVAFFSSPLIANQAAVNNTVAFLVKSGHTVHMIDQHWDIPAVEALLATMDGLVFSNAEGSTPPPAGKVAGKAVESTLSGSVVPTDLILVVKNFVNSGGRFVATGRNANKVLNEIFGENLLLPYQGTPSYQPPNFYMNRTRTYGTNYGQIFSYGLDMVSQYTTGRFRTYYNPYRTLPGLLPTGAVLPYTVYDANNFLEYCAYYFAMDNSFCSVWNRMYGPANGYISAIANSFLDVGTGFRSTYMFNEPWARALNIALGANPNDPASASPTPSHTVFSESPAPLPSDFTFSASLSFSMSLSETATPPPSVTETRTKSPDVTVSPVSATPSQSLSAAVASASASQSTVGTGPTASPTASLSFGASPSTSPSLSESNSASETLTPTISSSATVSRSPADTTSVSPSISRTASTSSSQLVSALPSRSVSASETPTRGLSRSPSASRVASSSASPLSSATDDGFFLPLPPAIEATPKPNSSRSPTLTASASLSPSAGQDLFLPGELVGPFAPGECEKCKVGEVHLVVHYNPLVGSETIQVDLVTDSGENVGTLFVPSIYGANGGFIDIFFATDLPDTNQDIGGVVVDINLYNGNGDPVSDLVEPLKICLKQKRTPKTKKSCLSYYEEKKDKWKCEDECLKEEDGDLYCGDTDHLTSFALLFNGLATNSERELDPCASYTPTYVFSWLTLGFVAGAIYIVLVSVVLIEFRFRQKDFAQKRKFASMSKQVKSNMSS